jgi:hypothetical protein
VRRLFYAGKVTGWMIRFVFRLLAGRNLFGPRRTDATFLKPATRQLDTNAPALHRWEMQRGLSRALWRTAGGYLSFLLLILLLLRGVETLHQLPWILRPGTLLLIHVSVAGIVSVSFFARHRIREHGATFHLPRKDEDQGWRWEKVEIEGRRAWLEEKILPVSRSVSVILGHSIPDRTAAKWVTVPKDYREPGGSAVEILLPAHFTGADAAVKTRLERSVSAKLGIRNISSHWQTEGSSPRVLLSSPPEPPSMVSFSDVEHLLIRSEEYRPMLGMLGGGQSLNAEMIEDSPHIALSAGPGAGKSTLAKLISMQALRWGWGVVVVDWKMTKAYAWMKDLPGVTYLSDLEDIHDFGVRVAQEVDIRKASGMTGRANVLIIRDEWNAVAPMLMDWWFTYRAGLEPEEKKITPPRSPALQGYAVLDFAGREFGIFDLCIAQRFSARIFNGNADIRECFQIKCLARYSDQTRKLLAPDIKPFPKKNNTPGRWTIVAGEDVAVVQVPFIQNEEAREYALGGEPNPSSPFSSSYSPGVRSGGHVTHTQGDQLGDRPTRPSQDLPVLEAEEVTFVDARKLSDVVDELEHLGITLPILQHAAKGDPDFPDYRFGGSKNRGYTYDFEQVKEWARRRYASQRVGK